MKISYNWLRQLIDFPHSPEQLSIALTDAGLEVEQCSVWTSVPGGLEGVVIGKVLTCVRHPNADRLHVTTVDTGDGEARQIVCGAPNVAAGQTVLVALPGAVLYPVGGESFEIRKSKIRGETSEGMICAEDEIGVGESHDGIMILPDHLPAGMPAADHFGIEQDWILDIGLTPNRADAAGHLGVARDIRAIVGGGVIRLPESGNEQNIPDTEPKIMPRIDWVEACIRYTSIELDGLQVGPSPEWMQRSLRKIGLRPINNVVDVTNYVMHELGQPLHAFDADRISGNEVVIGRQPASSAFVMLDGNTIKLSGEELMISDASGGLCIAGVYGGKHSGVTETTTRVFLESACFNPVAVRKSARRHGLHTDSSFRFERGTDPEITVYALKRAAALLCQVAGARVSSSITDLYPTPVPPCSISLRLSAVNRLIGAAIAREDVNRILTDLGITVTDGGTDELMLEVPAFKVDVTRPADVVEEILRIYGYNAIPLPERLSITPGKTKNPDPEQVLERAALQLSGMGYREILTNSLISKVHARMAGGLDGSPVELLNPLSTDLSIMRHSMLPGALETIAYNLNRKQDVLQLFELGKVYSKSGARYSESSRIGLYITGPIHREHWKGRGGKVDLYRLRASIDALLDAVLPSGRKTIRVQALEDATYGAAICFTSEGRELARAGRIRSEICRESGIDQDVYAAEIDSELLVELSARELKQVSGPPRFPEVRRDLSMLLDRSVTYAEIESISSGVEPQLLRAVDVFDVYEGDKIEAGKKSYALSFILRDDEATLQDKQIDSVMQKLMKQFESKLGAIIRKA